MFAAVALTAVLALPTPIPDPVQNPVQVGVKISNGSSLYRGKYYVPKHEGIRKCIRHRESRNHYNAVSMTGTFRGAYQFSPELRTGAAWMIQKYLRGTLGKDRAVRIGEVLRATSMNKWHPYWQDLAFWIVWDNGNGKQHWAHQVPGTECYR